MSYGFTMSFLNAENEAEALLKAKHFSFELMTQESAGEHIRDNLIYFRRVAGIKNDDKVGSKESRLLEYWLYSQFSVQCTYWPQHKLLAITGDRWPKNCEKLTAGSILFQDSTDQDYPLEDWPSTIPFFQERVTQAQNMSDAEIIAASDLYIQETGSKDEITYARRDFLYKRIFKDLDLNNWLYGGEGEFQRFAMSGITNWRMAQDLFSRALALMYKI